MPLNQFFRQWEKDQNIIVLVSEAFEEPLDVVYMAII